MDVPITNGAAIQVAHDGDTHDGDAHHGALPRMDATGKLAPNKLVPIDAPLDSIEVDRAVDERAVGNCAVADHLALTQLSLDATNQHESGFDNNRIETARQDSDRLETSESLVNWLVTSLMMRDFDEPNPTIPVNIWRKITDEIVERGTESVSPLLTMLTHADWTVRCAATTILGRLQATEAVWPLIACVRADASKNVQASAVNALCQIGNPVGQEVARQWKAQTPENKNLAIRNRINDFVTLGHTDKALDQRLNDLAAHYNVTAKDIAISCLTYSPHERRRIRSGDAAAIFGGLMLTEDEYRSIQELDFAAIENN